MTDVELASRLSFFLWSSIPDDELLALAVEDACGRRHAAEASATDAGGRARGCACHQLRGAVAVPARSCRRRPNDRLFPDFDDGLRQALLRETELFFGSILREDRSAVDLLNADYTFLNERLAQPLRHPERVRQPLPTRHARPRHVRAGLLGQGSILTLTSYATRTSPVVRGKWMLENILGAPPPPPPPNVPALKDSDRRRQGADDEGSHGTASSQCGRARAAMRGWIRSGSRSRISMRSAGGGRGMSRARRLTPRAALPEGTTFDGIRAFARSCSRNPTCS